jgi:hypothetical protein
MMVSVAVLCHPSNTLIMIVIMEVGIAYVYLCSHFHAPVIACLDLSLHLPRYQRQTS